MPRSSASARLCHRHLSARASCRALRARAWLSRRVVASWRCDRRARDLAAPRESVTFIMITSVSQPMILPRQLGEGYGGTKGPEHPQCRSGLKNRRQQAWLDPKDPLVFYYVALARAGQQTCSQRERASCPRAVGPRLIELSDDDWAERSIGSELSLKATRLVVASALSRRAGPCASTSAAK